MPSTCWLHVHKDLLTSFFKLGVYFHILPKISSSKFLILTRLFILIERPNSPLKQCLSNLNVHIHYWRIQFVNTASCLVSLRRDIKFYISNTLLGDVDSAAPWTPLWVASRGHIRAFIPIGIDSPLWSNHPSLPLKPFHWVLIWDLQIPSILNPH